VPVAKNCIQVLAEVKQTVLCAVTVQFTVSYQTVLCAVTVQYTRLHCTHETMPLDMLMFPSHSEFDTTVFAKLALPYLFLRTL
jgi:hypothetical protein